MDALKKSHPVDITWRAYFLRPPGAGPISEGYRAQILAARPRMAKIARDDFHVEMHATTFTGTVTEALIGAKYAEEVGHFDAYQSNVFKAYWQEDRDISDPEILTQVASASGIKKEAFIEALSEEKYLSAVEADVDQAFAYGINGVPAMILDHKYLVTGARPYPALAEIIEQVIAQRGANGAAP